MKRRDIVIAVVVLLVLAVVVYFRQKNNKEDELKVPETLSVEESLEEKFNIQIPDDGTKSDLKDVSGGNYSGIFSYKVDSGKFVSSFIVDLPQPETGKFYEAWLSIGEEGKDGYVLASVGRLSSAKGGYLLDFTSNKDYSDYDRITVTLESKADGKPEKKILEGSF